VETSWYDASIRAMDVELERLVEHLRGAGREGETLIVLLSDHGTEFYEHGTMFHGHSLYGELTDVPILASWPGRIAAGRTIDPVVQTIDVVPTLLELAGLPPVPEAQGQSLVPFLRPDAAPAADGSWPGWRSRPAVSERSPNTTDAQPPRHHVSDALTGDRFKLVQNRTEGFPPFELYDWRADPLNQKDLAVAEPEVVKRMAAELDAWRRRAEAQKLPADTAVAGAMSAEELQQLRSLGYIR
jgi:arylsulfatase A-like enzyme